MAESIIKVLALLSKTSTSNLEFIAEEQPSRFNLSRIINYRLINSKSGVIVRSLNFLLTRLAKRHAILIFIFDQAEFLN